MSNPKFMVFKLKDLRIPLMIVLIAVALFMFLLFKNKNATQTFSPSDTYQDGKYIAGISLSQAEMDLVVEVYDSKITSISLAGLDEKTSTLYKDLVYGIDYVNTYVTATQSLELPVNTSASAATHMLMDAVKVALSDDEGTQITSTYEKLNLPLNSENTQNTQQEIGVDAQADSQVQDTTPTSILEEKVIEQ